MSFYPTFANRTGHKRRTRLVLAPPEIPGARRWREHEHFLCERERESCVKIAIFFGGR